MDRRRAALIAVAGVALAAALYLPHLLTASWLYWEAVTPLWATETPTMGVRVWPWLVHVGFPTPAGRQLAQFALHGATAGLVGLLVRQLQGTWTWAALAGVLFLVNPIAVETVRHGTGAAETCMALGTLGACLAALSRRWGWMIVGMAVAVMSKEVGVVSLLLVPLLVAVYGRVTQTWWAGYALGVWLAGLLGLTWRFHDALTLLQIVEADRYATDVSAVSWGLVQATATLRLLTTAVTGVGMTADFDYDAVTRTWQIASVGALIGLGGLAWVIRRTQPLVAVGVAWLLLASAPRWMVQTPSAHYTEHQFYVALVGGVLALVGLLAGTESACGRSGWYSRPARA